MTGPAVVVGIKATGNSRAALRLAERVERLPGTTSQYVLRKAPCPILIVPDTETC